MIRLKIFICWIHLRPVLKPAWFFLSIASIGVRIRFKVMRLKSLAVRNMRQIPLKIVISCRFTFLGSGFIKSDVHCMSALHSFNTRLQIDSIICLIVWPPSLRTSAVLLSIVNWLLSFLVIGEFLIDWSG